MNDVEWGYVTTGIAWGGVSLSILLIINDLRRGVYGKLGSQSAHLLWVVLCFVRVLIYTFATPDAQSAITNLVMTVIFAVVWWFGGGNDDWKKRKKKLLDGAKVVIQGAKLAVARPAPVPG